MSGGSRREDNRVTSVLVWTDVEVSRGTVFL